MTYPPSPQPYAQASGEPPLWAPYYGAPFPAAVRRFFKKYATFSGRASRSEYWWWALVSLVVSIVLNVMMGAGSDTGTYGSAGPATVLGGVLALAWGLGVLIPSLAVTVRRLHDTNKSGWFLLLVLIPLVGPIVLLVFMLTGPHPAGQRFDQPAY